MRQRVSSSDTAASDAELSLTPAMRQYRAAKDAYPDSLLFFRMGDFYELFFDDAVTAARELQLTLTARDKLKAVPMCGVPYHAAEAYLNRLLRRGFRVAVCEQMEDPKLAKGVVRREVTRVLTPGTALDPTLGAESSNWMVALATTGAGAVLGVGVALLDLSTGDFRATEFAGEMALAQAADEVERLRPAELLHAPSLLGVPSGPRRANAPLPFAQPAGRPEEEEALAALCAIRTKTCLEEWVFTPEHAVPLLRQQMRVHSLDGLGLRGHPLATIACGAMLEYLRRTKQGDLDHLDGLRFYQRSSSLELDSVSARNLELVEPLFAGETTETTLVCTVDACLTPMGKRLLRATLLRPSTDRAEINARLDAVDEAVGALRGREQLRRTLGGVLDLERLLGRIALDSGGPRELLALGVTAAKLPEVAGALETFASGRWRAIRAEFDLLADLAESVRSVLVDEPPLTLVDGGAVRAGVHAELDELRDLHQNGRAAMEAIEARERARTGIGSLKVRFNSVFGYYLEITKTNARSVPAEYERKQTLVNAERYTTPELKELEGRMLHAQERAIEIERDILKALRAKVLSAAARVRAAARSVAEIDLLASFAHLASLRGWSKPTVDGSLVLEFAGGRHPVVERRMEESGEGRFVPGSLTLEARESGDGDNATSLALITGPNMGGKSTYLRMAALLVILAQSGSFVPADRMRVGVVDRIFTRIGASDNVARGRSTFMVEMTETASILNSATSRSLVLLDEMGRGTATFDGLSLAWATVEHLHTEIGARTLFATHYHELTALESRLASLRNLRVTVKETPAGIVFLHTVEPGAASKSYGIEVARLAGVPTRVIDRAREVLRVHERLEEKQVLDTDSAANTDSPAPLQMTIFTPLSQRIVDRLAAADIDGLTPRDALALLAELQRELRE